MEIINIKKLNYSYGKKEVLKELSLDIDKKKIEANIKALGPDEVVIKLFTDVKAVVKINVVAK